MLNIISPCRIRAGSSRFDSYVLTLPSDGSLALIQRVTTTLSLNYLIDLRAILNCCSAFESIILEHTVLNPSIWEGHYTLTVLYSFFPLSFVNGAIGPIHFTVTLPFVVDVGSIVDVATRPSESTLAIFLVHGVHTFELVAFV